MTTERYELIFQQAGPGEDPSGDDIVVVHRTSATGPGGHPVYCDDTGIVRAEISDSGEVRMLASGGQQALRRPTATHVLG
ncbi:DUF6296 family protein [Peterkaempfera bronchialis]|uniref:Uncharacterized protein n=1 Tax=Peterkaempfera bronchialis TaxID=2126346 RepID=A0A345T481_9ACTN|nr:DUF6296 family protein [Peterkaempfera bronchialis]AXI80786.1 hypothetical protein C7M71_028815 [Peterkaempfera bronchialis]